MTVQVRFVDGYQEGHGDRTIWLMQIKLYRVESLSVTKDGVVLRRTNGVCSMWPKKVIRSLDVDHDRIEG